MATAQPTAVKQKKKVRKNIQTGVAHISATFNNTIVSITDVSGNVIAWSSAGTCGFKGSRKSTPFAAQVTADAAARKGIEHGLQRVEIGLTYIYGIGRSTSNKLLAEVGVEPDRKVRDLTEDDVIKLRELIDSQLQVEGDLRRDRQQNVKRLQEIGSYRGLRHRRGLPVHGQNTKTNARSRKGPKRMQVAGKKKATKK